MAKAVARSAASGIRAALVRKHGAPGTMLTPVAVMVDFYSGWSFPRHLYTPNLYLRLG